MKAKLAIVALATLAAIGSAQAVEVFTEVANVSVASLDKETSNETKFNVKVGRIGVGHTVELENGLKVSGSVKLGKNLGSTDWGAYAAESDGLEYSSDKSARLTVGKAVGKVEVYGGVQYTAFETTGTGGAGRSLKQSQTQALVGVSVPQPIEQLPSLQSVSFEAGKVLKSSITDSGDYGNGPETSTMKDNGGTALKVAAQFKVGDDGWKLSPFVSVAKPFGSNVEMKTTQVGLTLSKSF